MPVLTLFSEANAAATLVKIFLNTFTLVIPPRSVAVKSKARSTNVVVKDSAILSDHAAEENWMPQYFLYCAAGDLHSGSPHVEHMSVVDTTIRRRALKVITLQTTDDLVIVTARTIYCAYESLVVIRGKAGSVYYRHTDYAVG